MSELFPIYWLCGFAALFAFVAWLTLEARGRWWRSLLLSFIAAAGLLQVPLPAPGPDGGAVIPVLLLLGQGASGALQLGFLLVVLLLWSLPLAVRGLRALFPAAGEPPGRVWPLVVPAVVGAASLQAVLFFTSATVQRFIVRLMPWLPPQPSLRSPFAGLGESMLLAGLLGGGACAALVVGVRRLRRNGAVRDAPPVDTVS